MKTTMSTSFSLTLPTEYYSSLVGYNPKEATNDVNISVYGRRCLSRSQKLAYMSSPTDSICFGSGGTAVGGGDGDTDDGNDGEGDLDLLRAKDGKSGGGGGKDDEVKSDGGDDNDGISDESSG
ncbi:hypothetical protein Tco_0683322 [Tanacetum coccineum]|uniref:Uncharacterized protein n=1 Tax=Tanacetum coccineum TaxID=301880 RepID=A0ABQ4XVD8_9ASTR